MGSNGSESGLFRSGKQGKDLLKEEEKTLNIWSCSEFRVTRRRYSTCEWEVIVQGDEGPFGGVAQVVDCHGVTVGHQEREEEEVEQEVESDGEKTLNEHCACPWMG